MHDDESYAGVRSIDGKYYWYDTEYPDEGVVGPYDTEREAKDAAMTALYLISE